MDFSKIDVLENVGTLYTEYKKNNGTEYHRIGIFQICIPRIDCRNGSYKGASPPKRTAARTVSYVVRSYDTVRSKPMSTPNRTNMCTYVSPVRLISPVSSVRLNRKRVYFFILTMNNELVHESYDFDTMTACAGYIIIHSLLKKEKRRKKGNIQAGG
ncbi:unnamed protein product [Macrosiphum euphorbiae]|uniref:Uncharacterized protein n=1 Tax=Macrosiphum euphorbiae TaxID=13131 RepID=A0AAV0WIB8_9HEMI|nr:unnamed protein product [Macrosiphum euphorbiae]